MMVCGKCQRELDEGQFFPSWLKQGSTTCMTCAKQQSKQWELANQGYRKTERYKENYRTWREANKPRMAALMRAWRTQNPERWKEITKQGRRKNIDKILIRNRQREIREYTAMPAWADKKKIQSVYEEAKRLTRETGIRHEVDHIYPLRGKTSCGLHVEYNLQIITASANRRKFNKMPEEVAC